MREKAPTSTISDFSEKKGWGTSNSATKRMGGGGDFSGLAATKSRGEWGDGTLAFWRS